MKVLIGRKVTIFSLAAALLLGGVALILEQYLGSSQGSAADQTILSCGRGVPSEKCNPSLDPTYGTPLPSSNPVPNAPAPQSPNTTNCGANFFSQQEITDLQGRFGMLHCFGLLDTNQWVVIGNGESINSTDTPPPASVGGSIIAVETCAPGDAACLGANTQHSFSQFSVFYPPEPSTGNMTFMTMTGTSLIDVTDGTCGSFTFNTTNEEWYATSPSSIAELLSGGTPPSAVLSPPSATGSAATTRNAPNSVSTSCFTG